MSPNRLLYKTSPCRFYSTATGAASCTKGEHCTFLHGEEKTSWRERAARREKNSGSAGGEAGEDDKHRLWRTEPCVYYQQGKCSRGDSCNYLHVAASGNQTPLGRKPCKIYAENGYCKWGTECRYVHQIPETSIPYINGVGLSSSTYRDPARSSESDSEDEDDFEVVLDQGVPSAASTPTGTGMAGRESGVTGEGEDAGGESEPEEEEIVLARDVHLAFKHLSVAPA
ncbi:hypothetical protein BDY24DRAFT_140137 [Mrakia frigida]|uniref:uncharacterized protein n=1 Tax=Mrakia frigida TaxID=29902 RepID=UPI003FCC23C5